MRNLYKIFDENIEKEEQRKAKEKEEKLIDKINNFYEKIKFIKTTSDLYNYYDVNYICIAKEILDNSNDYKLKNDINTSYTFRKMLYDFEFNTINKLYDKMISLSSTDINEMLISIYNNIKNNEIEEISNKKNPILDKNIKDIIENNIKEINNKITTLECENIKLRRNYEINEINAYYAYKVFIQMIIDRLYKESTNNPTKDTFNKEIVFTYQIFLSKVFENDNNINTIKLPVEVISENENNINTIKLPVEVSNHFKEFLKLFILRNNFNETNIVNYISDKKTYYIKAKVKDLLKACYREIQGFENTDKLIEDIANEENIELGKDTENPLTLKIE